MDPRAVLETVAGIGSVAAVFTRSLIALFQLGADVPRWLPGTVALLCGIGSATAVMTIQGAPQTGATIATIILAGILAAAESEGLSTLQHHATRAQMRRAVRRAALSELGR